MDFKRIRPTPGRVVVKLLETPQISKGGIYLPNGKQEITTVGEVVEVSGSYEDEEGRRLDPLFQVGDTVLFGKYSGSEVTMDRDKYVVLKEADVFATLHEE